MRTAPDQRHGYRILAFAVALLALACGMRNGAGAATLTVGPGLQFQRVSDAAKVARDGDEIEIAAATYARDVTVWTQRQLRIRGVGGRPVLDARGTVAEGKAIWVFRSGDHVVDGIEFRGARANDQNGAAIRFEGGRLVIRNCKFEDNENGILGGNDASAELVIEDSEFSRAPRDRGPLKHLLYVGRIGRFSMTGSRMHQGFEGHLVKSRARVSELRYNLIYDGDGGKAAYEVEFPDGGVAIVVGNVIGQSATTTNPVVVAYGAEHEVWPENALYLVNNTLTSDRPWGGWFLRVWEATFSSPPRVVAVNNLTVGLGVFILGAPGRFEGNFPAWSRALGEAGTLDFALGKSSWLAGLGTTPPVRADIDLAPTAEFRLPRGVSPIARPSAWTPGAFQTGDPRR
ncbi:MAG: hypothetical protein ABWY07_12870 [Burkholderiales bacterium]